MLFLTVCNINIQFVDEKLTCRSDITLETLYIKQTVEFNNKKEFAKAMMNEHIERFVVYMIFAVLEKSRYPDKEP